jgi:hypothetical protein
MYFESLVKTTRNDLFRLHSSWNASITDLRAIRLLVVTGSEIQ